VFTYSCVEELAAEEVAAEAAAVEAAVEVAVPLHAASDTASSENAAMLAASFKKVCFMLSHSICGRREARRISLLPGGAARPAAFRAPLLSGMT